MWVGDQGASGSVAELQRGEADTSRPGETDEVSDIFLSDSENPQMSYQYDISNMLGSKCAEIF